MIKNCPKCDLVNPPEAQRCDCGYDFSSGTVQQSYDRSFVDRKRRPRRIGYVIGIAGFSIMTLRAFVSTLDPVPDRRLLNTTPVLGFDVFLIIGLVGIFGCIVGLLRTK